MLLEIVTWTLSATTLTVADSAAVADLLQTAAGHCPRPEI